MLRVLDFVPEVLKEYVKLTFLRMRYRNCRIGTFRIGKNANLGRECLLSRDVEIGYNVRIGDFTYVNAGSIVASGTIGKFCSIGYFCQIGMPEHPTGYLSTSPRTYGSRNIFGVPAFWDDYPAPPEIGNDVWIGSQAIIMQRVRVGDGAVIAASSVVTQDVAPYAIVAGVPARELRKRFPDPVIERLLTLKWWDKPITELGALRHLFQAGDQVKDMADLC